MHALPRPAAEPAEPADLHQLRHLVQCLDVDMMARQVVLRFSAVPAGQIGRGNGRAELLEDMVCRVAELIRQWVISGDKLGEHTLSELYEAARAASGDGLAAEDAFRACFATARALWNMLLASVPVDAWGWLMPQADMLWGSLDIVLVTIRRAFDDQAELPSSHDNSRAGTLFARLCGQSATAIEDQERADRLGFPLTGFYCPFVLKIDGGSAASHAYLAARLRAAGALAYSEGRRVTGLTIPAFDWRGFTADGALILAVQPPTGRPELADGLSELHDLVTLAAAAGRRGRIRAEDFLTEILLANSPQLAERISRRVFGRLEEQDATGVLAQTLACLVAHGFDRATAAVALPVHRNTLLYRIKRIEKLSGLDLDRHSHRELVRLATVWKDSSGALIRRDQESERYGGFACQPH
jgi:PucR C-terminal helix-turn-helix domain